MFSNIYYIGDSGETNDDNQPILALYRHSLPYSSAPKQLIQGVENIQIRFGVRSNNTMRYVAPDDSTFEPGDVESMQIGLLMSSIDPISTTEDTQTYTLAGASIPASTSSTDGTSHAQDKRYRLAFNTTIKIRNRR